jgi:AcrR family transcriptional regulator
MLSKSINADDLRVRRTRYMLQEKFWELLAEQSFQSITVQDITARAMVNRATFYDHFVDKYALLQYSIREWFRETLDKQQAGSSGTEEDLKRLIATTCEFLAKLRYHCLPRDNAVLPLVQTTITDLIAEILTAWRVGLSDVTPTERDLSSTITSWAIYGAAFYWSQMETREPVEQYVSRVIATNQASLSGLIA